ncbi:MAG: 2-C-methyl-D-erythritol 2,4-cyclodiphosphate synthase [Gemmatimonadaceae bacterium]|nr:2-C-methyl-D-erythritol 2,4-cyclodiphosphate synthase [Gemmatimonadaceae bacterium]
MQRKSGAASEPSQGSNQTRVGIGYDSHRFDRSRPLILAGVKIEGYPGLLGHSDGDAVCHAVTDAILGAACAGDIGGMFPDSSEDNRGRDSIEMLTHAMGKIAADGHRVLHVDVVVITEEPKIGPHRAAMQAKLSAALDVEASEIGIKGKSNEGMGWIGRGEGLACMAVATLARADS